MRFGKFRPRFVSIGQANSLEESLVISANEGAISLQPSFVSHLNIPNVVMVPIAEKRHVGFIDRLAKRKNVQPFACLAGQFSTQGQVLREQVVQCEARDPRDREFPSRLFFHASPHECRACQSS
jgi:hypothetical protein